MADLNVIYRIAADISGLKSGVDRAGKATEGLESMAARVGKSLTAAFTVGAVLKLGNDVLDFASNLSDLSAQTGISTTGLQQFDLAFSQAGVTMETVASASARLANNLVGGDKSTVAALTKLGLSVKDLKQLAPEDQFIKVGDAIGKIQNPTERAYAAMQVFGKGGAELLKGLDGHLEDTIAQFEKLGLIVDEETIQQIDDFGDTMGVLGKQIIALMANAIGPLMPMLGQMLNAMMPIAKVVGETLASAFKDLWGLLIRGAIAADHFVISLLEGFQKIPGASKVFGDLSGAIAFVRADAQKAEAALAALTTTTTETGASAKKAALPLLGLGGATKEASAEAKRYAELLLEMTAAARPLQERLAGLNGTVQQGIRFYLAHGKSVKDIATLYAVLEDQVQAVAEQMAFEKSVTEATSKAFGGQTQLLGLLTTRYGEFHETLTGVEDATGNLTSEVLDLGLTFVQFGHQSATAFEMTTEGLREALRELRAGKDDWTTSIKSLGQAFVNLAQVSGGAMTTVARAIGTVLTTMDLAKTSGETFLQGFADVKAGKVQAGIGQITTSLVSMVGALQQATGSASMLENVIGGAATGAAAFAAYGAALGPYGAAVGAIYGAFRTAVSGRTASDLVKQLQNMQDAFEHLHGGMQRLFEDAATAGISWTELMNIFNNKKSPEEFAEALRDVQEALEFQAGAMATLDEAVKKYGFTLAEIGPLLQRQEIDKQAQQLYQDFKVLTAAGIDTATVIAHMSDAINAFVQAAISTGQEVPAAMKPILQSMIDQGKLIDANGNAYESLEDTGLSFAETMTQGFNRLIATVDKLTAAIARGLNIALDDLPEEKTVDVNVRTHYESETPPEVTPEYAATGGVVTTHGIRPMRWTPMGSDIVPSMLTPGEVVLSEAQAGQLAAVLQQSTAVGGGAGVQVHLTVNVEGVFSEGDLVSTIQRRVVPIIHQTWNDNVAGTRSRARDVLGVG